jgi:molecular chaperone DnaJ
MADTDYYELLQVERTADEKTLKSAYRRIAMECHPDRNPGCKDSEARFKAVSEAYDCLKDPQKARRLRPLRPRRLPQRRRRGRRGAGFRLLFRHLREHLRRVHALASRAAGRSNVLRGSDLRYDLEIGLDEAYAGHEVELRIDTSVECEPCGGTGAKSGAAARTCSMCQGRGQVRAQQGFFVIERVCPTCRGVGEVIADPCERCRGEGRAEKVRSLEVRIPPGVDEGTRIRLSAEGEAGVRGGPKGDLYIFVHLKRHDVFQRDGTTLFTRCPVSFTTAALGGSIDIPGLDKTRHEVKIPPGIQSGKQLRIRGAGMPVLSGRGHGDMVVQVEVETPDQLSSRQKELLEEFRKTETGDECPASQSFFGKLKALFDG